MMAKSGDNGDLKRPLREGAAESQRIREHFLTTVEKVADGSVYTLERLQDIVGGKEQAVINFVRMCEVYPGVILYRRWRGTGAKGTWEYSFQRADWPAEQISDRLRDKILEAEDLKFRLDEAEKKLRTIQSFLEKL